MRAFRRTVAGRAREARLTAQHGAGCVAASRSRATGVTVQLYRPGAQEDSAEWLVVCRDHATCVTVPSRRSGRYCLAHPEEFCDDCRDVLAPPRRGGVPSQVNGGEEEPAG